MLPLLLDPRLAGNLDRGTMAINATFGAAMKKECFRFEEGVTFLNHGSYGAIPIKIRDKQQQ